MAKWKSKTTSARHDHYQELTNRIVAALETGVTPWRRPWDPAKSGGPAMPINAVTGRRYRGINVVVLAMSPLAFMSQDPRFVTYKQAVEHGWQIKKGSKSTIVYFYKPLDVADKDAPPGDPAATRRIPLLRTFNVFHASQVEGIPDFTPPESPKPLWSRLEDVDTIVKNSGIVIRIGGEKAFYCPSTDHIQMPNEVAFISAEEYAATLLHEVAHASGAGHRLNRDLTGRYGSKAYSIEELFADLASSMVCGELSIPSDIRNHANYMGYWASVLKEDSRIIFRAAAAAQKIADYILGFHPEFAQIREPSAVADQVGDDVLIATAA
jgi:antirestriction protein ArdC